MDNKKKKGFFKARSPNLLNKAKLIAAEVNTYKKEYRKLTDEQIKKRVDFLSQKLKENKITSDDIIVDAFAIAREILFRRQGLFAHDVQIMGAYIIQTGDFAEMFTGEGKTLTILIAAFLNALGKDGVHIVTVNEYLVKRDAQFAKEAFEPYGITIGYNTSELNADTKRQMFAKDITYTTNSELGFDYLRDNMVTDINDKVIRSLNFGIIDEGDSILIDEARTPLIIAGFPKDESKFYLDADDFVKTLKSDDYMIDAESNTIALTEQGADKAETYFKLDNLYSIESSNIVHKITNALMANYTFKLGREYMVKDDKLFLIDIFTGRVLEGRSYNAGLHQAIQAKERVTIEPENQILATITYQSFFRLYKKISAVSGTALTEAEEFLKIYNMIVIRVPTNKPIVRNDYPDYIFSNKRAKWNHVIAEILRIHETGQPILVGTASVNDSELIHRRLKELKIPHEILNAKNDERESEIIKNGGMKNSIIISTNMAGRGTDIKINDEVKKLGGLYVIGTERHESRRIDNQLRGRSGRQGDPGESRFFTSLEDMLFKRFATDRFEKASTKLEEEEFFDSRFFSRLLDKTQKKVEGVNFDIRKNLMDYEHVVSLQRELIYKQRDQILLNENCNQILINMAKEYAEALIRKFLSKENSAIIDGQEMAHWLNHQLFRFEFFKAEEFDKDERIHAQIRLNKIFSLYIKAKLKILEDNQALKNINRILISSIDSSWTDHLDRMSKLKEAVNLRAYEQRSPLNLYIEDGNRFFENMKTEIVNKVINNLINTPYPNEEKELRELFAKNEY
ncbi:MAG: preprotein translocase subunit SecA [Mycoplasmoidaceae bacterium]